MKLISTLHYQRLGAFPSMELNMKAAEKLAVAGGGESTTLPYALVEQLSAFWVEQLQIAEQEAKNIQSGDIDTEALHRFRVAITKTRALLKLFKLYLPGSDKFTDELKWLSSLTNPIRDADIFMKNAHEFLLEKALPGVTENIESAGSAALKTFDVAMNGRRWRLLVIQWRTYVTSLPARHYTGPGKLKLNGSKNFLRALLFGETYRFLKKSLHKQERPLRPQELHKLRIQTKRLRYLIEAFPQLSKKGKIQRLHKSLKNLQSILGEHHDNAMIAEYLRKNSRKVPHSSEKEFSQWQRLTQQRKELALLHYPPALSAFISASTYLLK